MGKEYSPSILVQETANGHLFDYIANHYTEMSKYELKEVCLAVLGVGLDSCNGQETEKEYALKIRNELKDRGFDIE